MNGFKLCMVYTNNNNSKYILYTWYRPYTWFILSIIIKSYVFGTFQKIMSKWKKI